MIHANEAKRKTKIAVECKDLLKFVENRILAVSRFGQYKTTIPCDTKDSMYLVGEELNSLGYKVGYDELPGGYNKVNINVLIINWE